MDHVAIDLGGRESQICVRSERGEILEETRWPTRSLKKYLARRPPSRVVVESCAEAFVVADQAKALGHEPTVVPAMLCRTLGVGARGLKSDERDARNLSAASSRLERLPSVHVPSKESRTKKAVCGMREALVSLRTKLINTIRGWLRSEGLGLMARRGSPSTFSKRCRDHLKALEYGAIPAYVERVLRTLEHLELQIHEADRELKSIAKEDPTCQRLMTAPGVGPVVSSRFVAAIDQVERFPNAHAVESYIGLTPGEDSSSDRKRITSITKAGAAKLRWSLVQAAWTARRTRPADPMVAWALGVEARRGRRIAIIALSRKLAGVLFAMWRDGSTYSAQHHASKEAIAK